MPLSVGPYTGGNDAYSQNNKTSSSEELQNTISRLKQEQDKYKQQEKDGKTALSDKNLDNKIENLEKKINNLENRLQKLKSQKQDGKCETCENRKYQDGSNDPGVSFKNASKVSPEMAESAVRAHEQEHVSHNRAQAQEDDKEIVYQYVRIKHAICPECGRNYVAGGETVTVTRTNPKERFNVGMEDKEKEKGNLLDMVA